MPDPTHTTVHHLDFSGGRPVSVQLDGRGSDIESYVGDLVSQILNGTKRRSFRFVSQTTEVCGAICACHASNGNLAGAEIIAQRLLHTETAAQQRYDHITRLRKGSLVQSWINDGGAQRYVIAKVDHDAFLDGDDLTKRIGLPYEKQVLKTCLAEFDSSGSIANVLVSDTNARIADYWWREFLELEAVHTDEVNTRSALNWLDTALTRKLKNRHKADYTYLRNNLIGYFRTQAEFDWSGLLDSVIGDYKPEDDSLNIVQLKADLMGLPEEKGFDRQFTIVASEVKKRMKRVIRLSDSIDLTLKQDINDLKDIIAPVEEAGIKYLKIRTDEGFEAFQPRGEQQ